MSNENLIIYAIILIIIFVVWYNLSKNYIIENIQIACKTGEDNSDDIFWGIIIRYFISLGIGYGCVIAYAYFMSKK